MLVKKVPVEIQVQILHHLTVGGSSRGDGTAYFGCSGGGGTDIRIGNDSLYARVIVAGGGGGASGGARSGNSVGGYGGGINGGSVNGNNCGTGGTSTRSSELVESEQMEKLPMLLLV